MTLQRPSGCNADNREVGKRTGFRERRNDAVSRLNHSLVSEARALTTSTARNRAAEEIWERYGDLLRDLALTAPRRPRAAVRGRGRRSAEHVQELLLRHGRRGRFTLDNRSDLWKLRPGSRGTRPGGRPGCDTRGIRDVGEEQPTTTGDAGPDGSLDRIGQVPATGPGPADEVERAEALEGLLGSLPDPVLREIAQAKLEGLTNEEIAARRGCVVRTVERKLQRIREAWQGCVRPTEAECA